MQVSPKKYSVAVCLSAIFGILGINHFYLGRWLHGLFDVCLTVTGFYLVITKYSIVGWIVLGLDWIHSIIITILLLIGAYKDGTGRIVCYPGQEINKEIDNRSYYGKKQ